jgi:hypothetical protein
LGAPSTNSAQLVASADISGSKDLIPTQVLVSYNEPSIGAGHSGAHDAQTATGKVTKTGTGTTGTGTTSTANTTSAQPLTHRIHPKAHATLASANVDKAAIPGVVTVVYKDPSGVLAVDVSLMHR